MSEIAKVLAIMAAAHQKNMPVEAVNMLLSDLNAYPAGQVLIAIEKCRRELSRFPTVADIIQRLPGEQCNPSEIVGRILYGIQRYGYLQPEEIRKFVGEIGWRAVNYFGGVMSICEYPSDSVMALRAQLRACVVDAIEAFKRSPEKFEFESLVWRGGGNGTKGISQEQDLKTMDFRKLEGAILAD